MSKEFLTSTMEDYLEVVFNLEQEVKAVRVKDIAGRLRVKLPTVTSMLTTLVRKGLINHEKYEYVELTREGLELATEVNRRHEILRRFFTDILKIDASQADADACKIEHAISPVSLEALVRFMEFIENCPRGGAGWLEYFSEYCRHGRSNDRCLEHMKKFMENYGAKSKSIEEKQGGQMTRPLSELSPGEKGKIAKVTGTGPAHRRILDMGVVPGAIVEVERVAPLGDPMEIKIKGYHLSLRKDEVAHVYVEALL